MLALYAAVLGLVSSALSQQRLVNFAVTQPPVVPKNVKSCTHQLFVRNYANSYYE